MQPSLVAINSAIWIAWLGYWYIQAKEGGEPFDRSKVPQNAFAFVFFIPAAFALGFGLNEHGQKIRAMFGIGLFGLVGIPVILSQIWRICCA